MDTLEGLVKISCSTTCESKEYVIVLMTNMANRFHEKSGPIPRSIDKGCHHVSFVHVDKAAIHAARITVKVWTRMGSGR
jgi:hypothetical protein